MDKILDKIYKELNTIMYHYYSENELIGNLTETDFKLIYIKRLLIFQETVRKMYISNILPHDVYEIIYERINENIKKMISEPMKINKK